MRLMKMTLSVGLGLLLGLCIFGGFQESYAQPNQASGLAKTGICDRIQSSGYITLRPLPSWGSIVGTKDSVVNLSTGEVVYLKIESGKEVKPGDRFSVARMSKEVFHPVTKKKIGWLVLIPGELIILAGRENLVTAKIHKSRQSIHQGDQIILCPPVLPDVMPIRTHKKIEGRVLLSPEDVETLTQKEVIFIDRGSLDGVITGDLFSIYQKGDFDKEILKKEMGEFPLAKVGEAVVLSVQEETSTAIITLSTQAIYVGDKTVSGRK